MLYVSDDDISDEDFSPSSAKRRKKTASRTSHDNSTSSHSHSHSHSHIASPTHLPKGNFLAQILTDIPEVDICSLSSLSVPTPTSGLVTPASDSSIRLALDLKHGPHPPSLIPIASYSDSPPSLLPSAFSYIHALPIKLMQFVWVQHLHV